MGTRGLSRSFLTICVTDGLPRLWGHCHADSAGTSKGSPVKKQSKLSIAVIGFIVLVVIGISNCGGNATPSGSTSPISSGSPSGSPVGSPSGSPVGSPTVTASSVPTTAPPPQTTAPAAAPSTPSGCYPLTNGGKCYEPGEYCRNSDHGASGVAGDGEAIICEDNDGWRWEPA